MILIQLQSKRMIEFVKNIGDLRESIWNRFEKDLSILLYEKLANY